MSELKKLIGIILLIFILFATLQIGTEVFPSIVVMPPFANQLSLVISSTTSFLIIVDWVHDRTGDLHKS